MKVSINCCVIVYIVSKQTVAEKRWWTLQWNNPTFGQNYQECKYSAFFNLFFRFCHKDKGLLEIFWYFLIICSHTRKVYFNWYPLIKICAFARKILHKGALNLSTLAYISTYSKTHIMWFISPVTCHLSPVTCHLSPVSCRLSSATCHLSPVTCHMSPVTCQMSPVTNV